jgi:hypothetical protein
VDAATNETTYKYYEKLDNLGFPIKSRSEDDQKSIGGRSEDDQKTRRNPTGSTQTRHGRLTMWRHRSTVRLDDGGHEEGGSAGIP